MKLDIEALKAAALAATPGPWDYFFKHKYNEHHVSLPIEGSGMRRALFQSGCKTDRPVEDAQFIAAANPAAILALIERLERAENNREMWKAQSERQAVALEKQARAAKMGMDAAKANGAAMERSAKSMLAQSNPDALASERAANSALTDENERLRAALDARINTIKADRGDVLLITTQDANESIVRQVEQFCDRTGTIAIIAQAGTSVETIEAKAVQALQAELRRIYNEQAELAGWKP